MSEVELMEFYLFDRSEKIIHFDDLNILTNRLIDDRGVGFNMSRSEIFVIQIALLSHESDRLNDVISSSESLDVSCINTDVTDKFGVSKKQSVDIKPDTLQPIFLTVEARENSPENVQTVLTFVCDGGSYDITLNLNIKNSTVKNMGYDDLWRMSRLKWLNSTLMQNDGLVKPYTSPEVGDNGVSILGRKIITDGGILPSQVCSYFDEGILLCDEEQKRLFYKPCEFLVGNEKVNTQNAEVRSFNNRAEYESKEKHRRFISEAKATVYYDGRIKFSVKITPSEDFETDDVALNFYINKDCSSLMHGLGYRAGKAENLTFKWNEDKQQDCIFIGGVNCGMRLKLKAENYRRPLINIFYKNLPLVIPTETWDNNSRGEVIVRTAEDYTLLSARTGTMLFKKGESRSFDFELHITPLKPYDYKKQFSVRYSHSNNLTDEIKETDEAAKNGLNYVVFHQGNMIMPYINYPFYETDRLKNAVDYAGKKGIGIKLYYTEREHSNHMAETFAYKALGDEIILRKQGVSHSWQKEKPQWLVENFGDDIIPGWFVNYNKGKYKGEHDISFIVRPDTRLDNYYIEGLNWLINNIGIKGIYIDDTSLDCTTLERAKKLLDKVDGLIDMHMWNHEEPRAGDVSCLNLYCELLPFLDSIWLGEGFFYKKYSPEYMLAEVSGIPYGVGGQMLQDGGDLYEGMLYAMNNRYGWGYKNAVDLYKIWDEFGIENSRMLGYWHSKNPIKTDNKNVLVTVYKKENAALLCVYNFSKKSEKFRFNIDKSILGFDIRKTEKIKLGSSSRAKKDISKLFRLRGRRGMMLLLK